MRIGYLISTFPRLSETFVVNDVRGLEALGHEVVVFALDGPDPETAGNPNYVIAGKVVRVKGLGPPLLRKVQKLTARQRLRKRHGAYFEHMYNDKPETMPEELWADRLTWDAAVEQIDREGVDFLYVDFAMRQLLLGYHASRLLRLPLAVTLHAHDIFTNPLAKWFPQTLGQCDFVATVSQYNRLEILRLAPLLDASRVRVLAKGLDVDAFRPQPHDAHRPFRFATTGRLVEIKGYHVLVEAAGLLARQRRDFVVQVVGEGPYRELLERRTSELGIGEQFQLLGKRDAAFLKGWLPQQDGFLMPCVIAKDGNRDGIPVALREGMACGLPSIATSLLGLSETVSPETGYLVDADDPAALARAMGQMIDLPPAAYGAMAGAARQKAAGEFSLACEVQTLERWMTEALRRRPVVTDDGPPAPALV